jgi:lipopolysaccharide transport system ATP-binding protein
MSLYVHLEAVSKVFPLGVSATGELAAALSADRGHDALAGGKVAVDQLSLTISEGERLGIVGRNGAGKSTLLHMIAGISDPTSGVIRINGKVTSIMTLGVGLRED